MFAFGLFVVQAYGQEIEEQAQVHGTNGIRAGSIGRRQLRHTITQFLSAAQVEITPRTA